MDAEGANDERPTPVKCLVWDLDDTLWSGTLLEDEDVKLSGATRDVIVELDSRGILQSVSSKNDPTLAWRSLERLGIAEYFIYAQIGWGRKSDAVRRIADHLNFAHHTIAFIDDQPAERAEVAFHLPQVRCYPAQDVTALPYRPEFTPDVITVDSGRRREMYQAGLAREASRAESTGPDEEFLRSLRMVMCLMHADEKQLSRVEELTLRTSQMNATGVHYSAKALRARLTDPWHDVLVATLTDRFGPHGAIGVVLLERFPSVWHLKLLATSCRVVSFGVGSLILRWLIDQAAMAGVHLLADFRSTGRNRIMEITYRFVGFDERPCACRSSLPERDGVEGITYLHLIPTTQRVSTTMRLTAPDLYKGGIETSSLDGAEGICYG